MKHIEREAPAIDSLDACLCSVLLACVGVSAVVMLDRPTLNPGLTHISDGNTRATTDAVHDPGITRTPIHVVSETIKPGNKSMTFETSDLKNAKHSASEYCQKKRGEKQLVFAADGLRDRKGDVYSYSVRVDCQTRHM